MSAHSRICLALDGLSLGRAITFAGKFGKSVRALKVHDVVDRYGPAAIMALVETNESVVWVDYKIHDTKDTVALRVKALVENGAKIITVHASGGVPMMRAAIDATKDVDGKPKAYICAVTVLTSLDDEEIKRIYGRDRTREQIVHEFALMAKEAGVRIVVCSALEIKMLESSPELEGVQFIVPGVRSAGVELGQQKRTGTPAQAISDGADSIVVGTQVTRSNDPERAFSDLACEIEGK